MSKQIEALKQALEALNRGETKLRYEAITAIREALTDSALERMAESERELGLDYMETVTDVGGRMKIDASAPLVLTPHPAFQQAEQKQPYAQTAAYIESATNGRMHVDPVTGDVSIGKKQPAQGCDYCNNPQYAGTKCKNCGREQPAQQHIENCIWARNGNAPCPHVQPAQQESEAVRAAWMAGYTEGEREAIEKEQPANVAAVNTSSERVDKTEENVHEKNI